MYSNRLRFLPFFSGHARCTLAGRGGRETAKIAAMDDGSLSISRTKRKMSQVGLDGVDLGLDALHLLLLAQFRGAMLLRRGLVFLLALFRLAAVVVFVVLLPRVLADRLVRLLVEFLQPVGLDVIVNVPLKLRFVPLLVVVGQGFHVLGHVPAEDVFAQRLGVELLGLDVVPGESVVRVRDQDPPVRRSLHGSEHARPRRGARQADVQVAFERPALLAVNLGRLREFVFAIGLLDAGKVLVQFELRQGAAGDEESRGVGCGPIGETMLNAVPLEFMRIRGAEYLVPRDFRRHDLDDNVTVGEAHHQAVFGRIVFVLGLRDESLACVIIGFADAAAFVFGLESAIRGGLINIGVCLKWFKECTKQERMAKRKKESLR